MKSVGKNAKVIFTLLLGLSSTAGAKWAVAFRQPSDALGRYAMRGRAMLVNLLCVVMMVGLVLSAPSGSLAFTLTTIDVPGTTSDTQAFGINDAAQIVGRFFDATGGGHGFVKDGATFTTIDVPGASDTEAFGINDAGQIVGHFFDVTGAHGFVTAPETVPFAAFDAKVEIEDGEFELKGTFTLGSGSDGIDPLTEDVAFQVGTFSTTIPAGSFKFRPAEPGKKGKPGKPDRWTFEGVIDGVELEAKITDLGGGSFEFKAEGEGADLTGTVNPVTVGLTIGNDGGSTMVEAEFE